jgi:hypothetical protein
MFSKLLYKLFKRQFLKHYFLEQSNNKGFEKMRKVFVDSNAKTYWMPENDFDTPLERLKAIERCVRQLAAGLSESEDDMITEAMEKALGEGKKPQLAMLGHLIIEKKRRKEMLLHPDVMFDLVANKYIREDEDPSVIDKTIHAEKIAQFKKDSKDGLYDFFYRAGLSQYIPYLTKLGPEWDEYWRESEATIKAMHDQVSSYLSGELSLTK